jgi:hypothetical protein
MERGHDEITAAAIAARRHLENPPLGGQGLDAYTR